MILDTYNEFCDAVALNTGAAGTYNLGNQIDTQGPTTMGAATRDLGNGSAPYLVIQAASDITTGGVAGTLQFLLASDAQVPLATDGSATEHFISKSYATSGTAIPAGTVLAVVELPSGEYERYLGIQQVTGTTALNAGSINAFLVLEDQASNWKAMADAPILGTSL